MQINHIEANNESRVRGKRETRSILWKSQKPSERGRMVPPTTEHVNLVRLIMKANTDMIFDRSI